MGSSVTEAQGRDVGNVEQPGSAPASRRSRTIVVVVIVLGVAIMLTAMSLVLRPVDRGDKSVPIFADEGGAPSGTATGYVEISGAPPPAAIGRFDNRARDGGPLHRDTGIAFLGNMPGRVTEASAAELTPSSLSVDDGLVIPWNYPASGSAGVIDGLAPCSENRVLLDVNMTRAPESLVGRTGYINLFFDWDRNGRFDGSDGCSDEWGVKNFAFKIERQDLLPLSLRFRAGRQTMDFWYRVVLTIDQPMSSIFVDTSFNLGETEDVHWLDPSSRRLLPEGGPPNHYETCAEAPPAVIKSGTRSLVRVATGAAGSRPVVEFPTVHGQGDLGPDVRALDFRSTLAVEPARSSAWVELLAGETAGISRGRIEFQFRGERIACRYIQVGPDALKEGAPGPISDATPTASSGTQLKQMDRSSTPALHCPYRELNGGEVLEFKLQDFSLAPGSSYANLSVISQPSDSTATAEGTKLRIHAAVPPKSAFSTWKVRLDAGDGEVILNCATTVNGKLPARSQLASSLQEPGGRESQHSQAIFGGYKVRFAKKTDSCGNYPLRQEEVVQIRQAPANQIELHRPATGNKSTGNLNTSDNSFLATGSGVRKDGRQYVEQYLGKFSGSNVSGSYELQEGDCRATFSFEGTKN